MTVDLAFHVPMFWWYIPALLTVLYAIFWLLVFGSQDSSGAGMVGFFIGFPAGVALMFVWLLYFMAAALLGIR